MKVLPWGSEANIMKGSRVNTCCLLLQHKEQQAASHKILRDQKLLDVLSVPLRGSGGLPDASAHLISEDTGLPGSSVTSRTT